VKFAHLHPPASHRGAYGQSSDLEIQAREIMQVRAALESILARHTGKDEDQVRQDIERDRFLTADEAKGYGLVDEVLTSRKEAVKLVLR
jgi:ATP-dependent Clp protease protease subunit